MAKPTGKRILLVEDDGFLAGMYVAKLELEHFEVVLASDGEEGWEKIQSWHPDLVLLDIILPKKNGFQVLASMKKDPATQSIPVMLLTNLGQPADVERAKSLGADDYLIKAHHMPAEVIRKIKLLFAKLETKGKTK